MDNLIVNVYFKVKKSLKNLVISTYLLNKNSLEILGFSTAYENLQSGIYTEGEIYCLEFTFVNRLIAGTYAFKIIAADNSPKANLFYDWIENAIVFNSHDLPGKRRWALYNPHTQFTLKKLC